MLYAEYLRVYVIEFSVQEYLHIILIPIQPEALMFLVPVYSQYYLQTTVTSIIDSDACLECDSPLHHTWGAGV